jgi:hypothetical protein
LVKIYKPLILKTVVSFYKKATCLRWSTETLFELRRSSVAVLDQAFIAGGLYLVNITVARQSSYDEYGKFLLYYSFFNLALILHAIFVLEPLMLAVRVGGWVGVDFRHFEDMHIVVYRWLLLLVGLGWAISFYLPEIGPIVAFGFGASSFILNSGFRKSYLYQNRFKECLFDGFFAFVLLFLLCILLGRFVKVSIDSSFICIGVASFIRYAWKIISLRNVGLIGPLSHASRVVAEKKLRYSISVLPIFGMFWLSNNLIYILAPSFGLISFSGKLRMIQNIFVPISQFNNIISGLSMTTVNSSFSEEGVGKILLYAKLIIGACVFYGCFVFFGGAYIYKMFYDRAIPIEESILALFSFFYVLEGLVVLLHSVLKATGGLRLLMCITAIQLALSALLFAFISKNQDLYMFQVGVGCVMLAVIALMVLAISVMKKKTPTISIGIGGG